MDDGVLETWKGFVSYIKKIDQKLCTFFRQAEEKGTDRVLKNFGHFGNEIYNFIKKFNLPKFLDFQGLPLIKYQNFDVFSLFLPL